MKTRTLLLLAIGCGVAILLAGAALLWRLSSDSSTVTLHSTGEVVKLGDLNVTIAGYQAAASTVTIDATIGGADDADGQRGFALNLGGNSHRIAPDSTCDPFTVAPKTCRLVFQGQAKQGALILLTLVRSGDRVSWALRAGTVGPSVAG